MSSLPLKRRNHPALRYILLLLVGAYPFVLAWGAFAGIEPLDQWAVLRGLAGTWFVTFVLYGLSRLVIADADNRALWLGLVLLGWSFYGILGMNGMQFLPPGLLVASLYALGAIGAATLLVRPWQAKRRDLIPLTLVAVALVGVNAGGGVARLWAHPSARWRPAADGIVSAAERETSASVAQGPDIYYIVLDGLGRADTLKNDYGLDVSDFVADLRARGFFVADHARSNYAQTLLSFSSFLNLGYLDAMAAAMGKDNESWLPLADLIERNALMRLAKQAGFHVTAIGSDYGPTKRFREADACVCEWRGLDMFEQVLIDETVFAALPLDHWTYGAHRRTIFEAFAALERPAPGPSLRQFVFAHVLTPHPPFTFGPDGEFRRPDRSFMFNEGSDFRGSHAEYVQGYRDQAAFTMAQLRRVIDAILSRPGPRPVIIIHGDHGPGSMLQQNDAGRTNLPERMNIFAAYFFPDGPDGLYPSITPVNAARVLANRYLGTSLPALPDRSWFSPSLHPFDFTLVAEETKSGKN